jgi:hypothetical protein
VLAVRSGADRVRGMHLMGRCDVDNLDRLVGTKLLDARIGRRAEVGFELRACLGTGVGAATKPHARIGDERRQHQRERPPKSDDTPAALQRGLRHASSTSRGVCARDTQTMIVSPRSASDNTRSRWSAIPSMSRVRHVPHVPLSHELGTSSPCARKASSID